MGGVGSLINHMIGFVILYIWMALGGLLSLFGAQQAAVDGVIGVYESFAPAGVSEIYKTDLLLP